MYVYMYACIYVHMSYIHGFSPAGGSMVPVEVPAARAEVDLRFAKSKDG